MPTLQTSRQRAKDERLQAHRIDERTFRVYNIAKGTSYDVLLAASGVWHCTCPYATKSSSLNPGNCKHLTRVLDKINKACVTCGREDQKLTDFICPSCRFENKMREHHA